MIVEKILQLLTVCQGVWVLTLMAFLMHHYTMKSIKNRLLEANALGMGISYSMLTAATMITSYNGLFPWYSPWQFCTIIGYIFGDIAIVKMVFHVYKNHRQRQLLEDEILRELKKEVHQKLEDKLESNGGLEK